MLGEHTAEAAAANDDGVERAGIALRAAIGSLRIFVDAMHGLVEAVAHVSAENIDSEVRQLGCFTGCPCLSFLAVRFPLPLRFLRALPYFLSFIPPLFCGALSSDVYCTSPPSPRTDNPCDVPLP